MDKLILQHALAERAMKSQIRSVLQVLTVLILALLYHYAMEILIVLNVLQKLEIDQSILSLHRRVKLCSTAAKIVSIATALPGLSMR